jgi:predicted Rdx family selenoprotein
MAGEALSRNGDSIAEFNLIPSTHGLFHIYVDDELVASHQHLPDAHLFPDLQEMMAAILARI